MSLIDRRFQLADDAASLGLHCSPDGVTLAGISLLRTTITGLAPRPRVDLGALLKAAYGRDLDPDALASGLTVVAKALNDGDLGRAMVAAVRLQLPDLDDGGAARLADVDGTLSKAYNGQEPRDWRGRWTTGGAGAGAKAPKAHPTPPRAVPAATSKPPAPLAPARPIVLQTAAAGVPPRAAVWEAFNTLYPNFQSQFDNLGPVDFAKRVIRFAEWIEIQAHDNRPMDRAAAKAEYYFLQNRLTFWLGYQYKSPGAHLNILGAGSLLYEGAITSGLLRPGDSDSAPWSMAAAIGFAAQLDGSLYSHGPVKLPKLPELPEFAPTMAQRAGVGAAEAENAEVGVGWGRGIQDQGVPWETQLRSEQPADMGYFPRAKTWDFASIITGRVISAKTLDTTTFTYASNPQKIFSRLKNYIDSASNYELDTTRLPVRVPLDEITSREIQLAIPEETSPAQMEYVIRAQRYSESRGVKFVVTRIK